MKDATWDLNYFIPTTCDCTESITYVCYKGVRIPLKIWNEIAEAFINSEVEKDE